MYLIGYPLKNKGIIVIIIILTEIYYMDVQLQYDVII